MKKQLLIGALGLIGTWMAFTCIAGASSSDSSVRLKVTSTIFGTADTGNKSTLKKTLQKTEGPGDINIYHYDENGKRVAYPEGTVVQMKPVEYTGAAVLNLGKNADDRLIDGSKAVVSITNGDGYNPKELILNATKLDSTWKDGTYYYTLGENDIQWNTEDYPLKDNNSTREWSVFGGDGNGFYTFNLKVSGIKYSGKEVEAVIFPLKVYIWGRDATDVGSKYNSMEDPVAVKSASNVIASNKISWNWTGTGDKPILCDDFTDNFFVTWPKGKNASSVSQDDVIVTLYNQYGASYKLSDEEYTVFASPTETQVAVTYKQWSTTPVYTTMKISIKNDGLSAGNTYEIASVYTNMVQSGGGGVTVDGTVTAYSYYGFANLADWREVVNPATYTLTTGKGDSLQYYAEKEDGTGYLTSDKEKAKAYDASGEDESNEKLIVNTVMITTRLNQTAQKGINGGAVTLNKTYNMAVTKTMKELANGGLIAAPGYVIGNANNMWAWQDRFRSGWTPDKPAPTSSPYTTFPYGFY